MHTPIGVQHKNTHKHGRSIERGTLIEQPWGGGGWRAGGEEGGGGRLDREDRRKQHEHKHAAAKQQGAPNNISTYFHSMQDKLGICMLCTGGISCHFSPRMQVFSQQGSTTVCASIQKIEVRTCASSVGTWGSVHYIYVFVPPAPAPERE